MAAETGWSLNPQLAKDTTPVGDLALCRVVAMNAAGFPWLILVPRRDGAVEISDLGDEAHRLMDEIVAVGAGLKSVVRCDKLNVGAIGNVVPQLHVHVIARRFDDPLWPKPIWGVPLAPADAAEFAGFVAAVRSRLGL